MSRVMELRVGQILESFASPPACIVSIHCFACWACSLSLSLTPRVRAISIATHAALRTSRPLLVTVQQWRAQTTLALTLRCAAPQRIWRGC